MRAALDRYRARWVEESDLRLGMEEDLVSFGLDRPAVPVEPDLGWPSRLAPPDVRAAMETCVEEEAEWPTEPAQGLPMALASSEAVVDALYEVLDRWAFFAAGNTPGEVPAREAPETCGVGRLLDAALGVSAARDAHYMCARWARIGECASNPGYMLSNCRMACDIEGAFLRVAAAAAASGGKAERPYMTAEAMIAESSVREAVIHCVAERITADVTRLLAASSAEQNAKSDFSEVLRNETCKAELGTRGPLLVKHGGAAPSSLAFTVAGADGHDVEALPLFRSDATAAANITLLRGFAKPAECATIIDRATPNLSPATVNEEGDLRATNFKRRAHAAHVDFDPADPEDPVARLWHRTFDVTNALSGYDLDHEGQEPFSIIHYNGTRTRLQNEPPDEYQPHCDGNCDGAPYTHGGRVATMLVYCHVPDRGGDTTFTNARTVVAPSAHDAALFTYYNRHTEDMDPGFTLHSGCPVLDGSKWVITLWMRKSVHKDDPWDRYDPSGSLVVEDPSPRGGEGGEDDDDE